MQLNAAERELTLKVVYYGPGLSGKTTNLQAIHARLDPNVRGRLMTLDTADDRTLFFDMMPVFFQTASGLKVRLKLFTVPGQAMHDSTRRLVLQGVDAVAFIADSQINQSKANNAYWSDLLKNLQQNGISPGEIPIVIQFNKRDLPETRTDEEIEGLRLKGKEPIFSAVAIRGIGVLETLHGLMLLTFARLEKKLDFGRKFGVTEEEFMRGIFRNLDLEDSDIEAAFG